MTGHHVHGAEPMTGHHVHGAEPMTGHHAYGVKPMTGHHAYGATGAGTVLLDLGPGAGALVLYTPAELLGQEIEISPGTPDDPGAPGTRRTHAAVRERPGRHGSRYAVVYAGLAPGSYTIWRDRQTPAGTVTVVGGEVTCHDWV